MNFRWQAPTPCVCVREVSIFYSCPLERVVTVYYRASDQQIGTGWGANPTFNIPDHKQYATCEPSKWPTSSPIHEFSVVQLVEHPTSKSGLAGVQILTGDSDLFFVPCSGQTNLLNVKKENFQVLPTGVEHTTVAMTFWLVHVVWMLHHWASDRASVVEHLKY